MYANVSKGFLAVLLAISVPFEAFAVEIEEIVVSVRKTDEDLQQVPIAVSVLDAERINRERLENLADVALQVPNVQFDIGFWPSDTRVSIRGLFARAGRPSAGILIDGIDASSESLLSAGGSALLNQRLLNLERIEIARGPQSALYGRTAFSGAVNYVTKRPEPDWSGKAFLDVAQGNRIEAQGILEGPITDELAFGLLVSRYQLDGYYQNQVNLQDIGGGTSDGVGLSFNWTPSDTFSAYLNTTFSNDKFDPQAVALVRANQLRKLDGSNNNALVENATSCNPAIDSCLSVLTGTIGARESDILLPPKATSFNVDGTPRSPFNSDNYDGTEDKTFRTNLILNWDLGWSNFRSSTSYTDAQNKIFLDTSGLDGIPTTFQPASAFVPFTLGNYTDGDFQFEYQQYYQEFQLNNLDSDGIDWLVGVNGFYEDGRSENNAAVWYRDNGLCPFVSTNGCDFLPTSAFPTTRFDKTQQRDTTSLSIFGLLGFDLTETLKLTLESRLIYDKVTIEASTADLLQDILDPAVGSYRGLPGFKDEIDDTNFVPRAALDWQFKENVMFYGSVANGIKPPTFNSADLRDPERQKINKEELWTYEIGSKTEWLDRQLIFNTAVFYNDYTDQQVRISGTDPQLQIPVAGATNAGKVHSWGIEIDTIWAATENLSFGFNYAFTDSEYDEFNIAEASAGAGLDVSSSEAVKAGNVDADFSGNTSPGIPRNAFNLTANYQNDLTANLGWYAQTSWSWQDERYADTANLVTLDDYSVVNAALGLQSAHWEAQLYGENLFDDRTIRYAQEFIDQSEGFRLDLLSFPVAYLANLPQPRTLGVRVTYRFD
jgi:outer membrane receptor protein involved in Fe transport